MLGFGGNKKLSPRELHGQLPHEFALKRQWLSIEGLGEVLLQEMDSGQRDQWEWRLLNRAVVDLTPAQQESLQVNESRVGDPRGMKAWLIANCLLDPATSKLAYAEYDKKTEQYTLPPEKLNQIDRLPARLTDPLYAACMVICGLRVRDFETAKKNSAVTSTSSDDSTSPDSLESPSPK